MPLTDEVRFTAAQIAADAQFVRVDHDALDTLAARLGNDGVEPQTLDPTANYLDDEPEHVATFLLSLDSINFGSGWWPTIRKKPGMSGYFTMATGLADHFRAEGPWTAADLRTTRADALADILGQRRDHELMGLYAQALRALGDWLGTRRTVAAIADAGNSAERLAEQLADGMAMYADRGFYKRAQIAASDLALAGVASFSDLNRLTIFADNLVPHVLRCDGVLVYDERLAALIDAESPLRFGGPQEREIRGSAVHAAELLAARLDATAHELDHLLWNRGQEASYKARPRHRSRCVFY
ncbi:MAG: hypothetical protein JHC95_18085 [Solirubrobacteraceae bacterium]|nr:hypothetical protein [Solirubrobacteraceae bacterium]